MNAQMLNIKFVQEVKKYPCLYNTTLPDYSRKDITGKAWSAVGKVVNLTEAQCKEKWRNMRVVLMKHLKASRESSSSKFIKPYYLTDLMHFAKPYIRPYYRKLPQDEIIVVGKRDDGEDTNDSEYKSEQDIPSQNSPSPPPYPPASTIDLISSPPHSPLHPSSSRKRKASSDDIKFNARNAEKSSNIEDTIMEYLKSIEPTEAKSQKSTEYIDIEDPKRMFLLSLLPDMRAMSDTQTRTFKRRVLELVGKILDGP